MYANRYHTTGKASKRNYFPSLKRSWESLTPKLIQVVETLERVRVESHVRLGAMSLPEMLLDLPKVCDIGTKRNSQGYQESWQGYKFHIDIADGDIPVSGILTSASVNDSKALRAELKAEAKAKRVLHFPTPEDIRYRERAAAERVNSNLKDNFGGRTVRVRGHQKVACHLMFGLLALTAYQLLRWISP
jgi:hypothetical protein